MKSILILLAVITGGFYGYVCSNSNTTRHATHVQGQVYTEAITDPEKEKTVQRIRTLLEKKKSPLAPYAKDFAQAAAAYRLPPELIVGITNQESSFGKHYPIHTNNPWNWGYCDSCHIGHSFSSIGEGAQTVAKGIATGKHYRKYQKTRDLNDLASVYLTGDRPRWVAAIEQVGKEISE